jgi:hypothetical protein
MGAPASDKEYWHRYIEAYQDAFKTLGPVTEILEFGVFNGGSIAWLAERFPGAGIVGVDILPQTPAWPTSGSIAYVQLDQGDRGALREMFVRLDRRYDLLIEDGSHYPEHQAACLVEGLAYVRPGGLYILEDIHTSHPDNPDFAHHRKQGSANSLHVLLAIQHLKERNRSLTLELARELASPSFFTVDELLALFDQVATLQMYRRSSLPLSCYACGSDQFDYRRLRCRCGVDIYSSTDSMAYLIRRA